jgi:muramidase (phage lysozyme)
MVDDGPRGHINHGVISLKAPDGSILGQYRFVNGGGGAGTIPHGAYDVTNFRDAASRKAQGLTNLGDTFDLNDVFDARAGRTRTALRIHEAHGDGTLGCIGIQGGAAAWRDFTGKMRTLVEQGGGKYTLVLGSEEGGGQGQGQTPAMQDGFARVLGTTGKAVGGYASPALQADTRAARILDFVAGAELNQASGGNYNAFFGNAGATEDLSKRTLDQTIAWSRDRGTSSSATGRYQFMADTMAGLKKEMGLSGSEAFTPELQDRMALRLLNRRGYREWAAGRISTDAFANALAKEWAALPNLQTGRSHYAGDGVNKALVSPDQVRAALTGTGAFPAARVEQAAQTLARQASGPEFSQRARTMLGGAAEPQAAPMVDAYSNAPRPDVAARMRALNPDPLATSDAVLSEVAPNLVAAIRKAQADNPKLRIVAVARSGEGVEVWPADAEGRVSFDPAQQDAVSAAIRRSAAQLGLGVNFHGGVGGGLTHIEVAPTKQA